MPKVKTRKSITKRFKISKNGKILRRQNFSRHLRVKKSKNKKRSQKKLVVMEGYFARKLKKAMGLRTRSKNG